MLTHTFDRALVSLGPHTSRRIVIGGILGLLGARAADFQGEARRKKRKKCRKGTKKCGKRCFNLQTDAANCGACGAACPADRVCAQGACACPVGSSLVNGACIPTFGCTAQADACQFPQTNCPQRPDLLDAFCFVTPEGQPFCGDLTVCVQAIAGCTPVAGRPRVLLSCPNCPDQGDIGVCVLPVAA